MSVTLHDDFATAADTAKVLGVSPARLKRILRLLGPDSTTSLRRTGKTGEKLQRPSLIERKKQTRGKVKKATR